MSGWSSEAGGISRATLARGFAHETTARGEGGRGRESKVVMSPEITDEEGLAKLSARLCLDRASLRPCRERFDL